VTVVISAYFHISHQAQIPNAIGRETATVTLEKYTVIQNNLPLLESNVSIILHNSDSKPFSYESYTLERIIPYYDEQSQQIMYWKLKDRNGGFLPQNLTEEEITEYIKTDSIQQSEKPESCSTKAFEYYNICIMTDRKRGVDLEKFEKAKIGMSSNELWYFLDYPLDRSVGTGGNDSPIPGSFYEFHYILNNDNLNFLVALFDIDPVNNPDTSKLQKIYIITDDKEAIEVPVSPDNFFDVQSVIDKIER